MSEPAALDEVVAVRNRLTDQRNKAAETVSTTLRTVAMGLAAVTYSFVFAVLPSAVSENRIWLYLASLFGIASVMLDVMQSFYERRSAIKTLEWLGSLEERPTARQIKKTREVEGADSASRLLVMRAVATSAGFVCIAVGVGLSLPR